MVQSIEFIFSVAIDCYITFDVFSSWTKACTNSNIFGITVSLKLLIFLSPREHTKKNPSLKLKPSFFCLAFKIQRNFGV